MSSSDPITSVFNDGYIAEAYDAYRQNPASVDESWRQFFRFAEQLAGTGARGGVRGEPDPNILRKVAGAASLMDAIRAYGHLAVQIDPLGTAPPGAPELTLEYHGLTEADLKSIPASAVERSANTGTAADVVTKLRTAYSSTLACEFEHLGSSDERAWLRTAIEGGTYHQPLSTDEQKTVLRRLTEVDALERFLGRAYQGYKRFSIEGSDALVVMLDEVVSLAAGAGAQEVAIAMAHRGRINVLAHILGKPYTLIFDEFEGKHAASAAVDSTGDVKYHMGYNGSRNVNGKTIALMLMPNPSHLELVAPVLSGVARAKQRAAASAEANGSNTLACDENAVLPVAIHGDAAFPGEGVVPETLNMSLLRGYRVGGTVHIIVNNQVGFTTDPTDARSTRYASDLAKGFDIPIIHVNGDDAVAYIQSIRLAFAYRQQFKKDVLIDLVSYRRLGHNETDEPAFTQPKLYQLVRAHGTPREVWGARLVKDGVLSDADVQTLERDVMANYEKLQQGARPDMQGDPTNGAVESITPETAVAADTLGSLNEQLLAWPETLKVNSRLARTLSRRRDAMGDAGGIDWGHAEALAFASLVTQGRSIRLTGQDVERGTFAHRQAVLHDSESGDVYIPLQHLKDAKGTVELYNSPLSETAVMGFEFGYSVTAPETLTLWEAQYGDFANVAQPVMDQFLSASHAKWNQDSGLVLLLPHGYEGGGPEHSSARLERYLQSCAEGNMCVAYPSTPAQYFHLIRRQALQTVRRPLILMQPKSMLRLPEAASKVSDLANGTFQPVIDDTIASTQREKVKRLVFCTGRVYYDLLAKRRDEVALVRIEELYPWPHDEVARIVDLYPAIEDVVWVQEEPKNMGAWTYVWPRLRVSTGNAIQVRYIGRPERASPAEGYGSAHTAEQARIVTDVYTLAEPASGKRAKATAR